VKAWIPTQTPTEVPTKPKPPEAGQAEILYLQVWWTRASFFKLRYVCTFNGIFQPKALLMQRSNPGIL
jgi:hypothetical protein